MPTTAAFAERLRTLAWFLRRPRLYPHLTYLIAKKLTPSSYVLNATGPRGVEWCAARAIASELAIERLVGSRRRGPVDELFPQVFANAAIAARACPTPTSGAADLDLLYAVAEHVEARRVIETGVALGWSSLAILLSLRNRPGSLLISTDMPLPGLNTEAYVGCVVPSEFQVQWSLRKRPDRQALPGALRELGPLDMCHYDSDKSYEGRAWAYPLLWRALRPGGVFISDDVGDNLAFCDFARSSNAEPLIVQLDQGSVTKYVGIFVKP
jgi:predicted O-methyltransferase YrrM